LLLKGLSNFLEIRSYLNYNTGHLRKVSHLFKVGLQQVPEVLDGVVPVLVERSQQLLETLLDTVGVGWVLVEGVGEAGHGHLLALKPGIQKFLMVLEKA